MLCILHASTVMTSIASPPPALAARSFFFFPSYSYHSSLTS
jgi:hypothetical protein